MYKSYNGKTYYSEEECEKADEEYGLDKFNERFLRHLEKITDIALDDGKYHKVTLKCGEYDLYVMKRKNKTPLPHLIIAALIDGEYVDFVRTTFCEYQCGFCSKELRNYLDDYFWNVKDKWIEELLSIYDLKVTATKELIREESREFIISK